MKKLYIRVDGNKTLGLGHVMRCMSIADAYVALGGECEFVSADADVLPIVGERNYDASVIDGKWDNLQNEIDIMIQYIKCCDVKLLLVDSYFANEKYFEELHKYVRLVYLSANIDRCYDIDVLINYTLGSQKVNYNKIYKGTEVKILCGVQYTPLRKQFQCTYHLGDSVENIFLTTGGTDADGIILKLFETIEKNTPDLLTLNWHIVVGKFYSVNTKNKLRRYCDIYKNIFLYENVKDMSKLMRKCDIAISAAGSTIYELCACGVPTVAFSFVDNQVKGLYEFSKDGLVLSVGDIREDVQKSINMIIKYITNLKEDITLRKIQAKKMKMFIDGKGAMRIAEELRKL